VRKLNKNTIQILVGFLCGAGKDHAHYPPSSKSEGKKKRSIKNKFVSTAKREQKVEKPEENLIQKITSKFAKLGVATLC
jgi:hypothetical protein